MKPIDIRTCARPVIGAVLLCALALATGCHKPDEELGLGVMDPGDALGTVVVDTTEITAWTVIPEAGKTNALSRNVLGAYLDPDFGLVSAGIVTQVRLPTNNVGTIGTYTCDSLVLSLAYDATGYGYGNLDPQAFQVLRLNEDLHLDSTYTTADAPTVYLENLLDGSRNEYPIQPYTSPVVGGDTLDPQLRLGLKRELGNEILSHWGELELTDNDHFLQYFKGLVVLPGHQPSVPYQQGALYFNLLNAASKLTLYYHGLTDTTSFDFVINTSCVRYTVSHFEHDRAVEPSLPLALEDTTQGQQEIYVQALGGLRGEVRFPHLDTYDANGLGALAKAELILPVSGNNFLLYPPPAQIFVFRKNDAGEDVVIPDQQSAANQVGGLYDETDREYRLVITQWVQGVIDGTYPNTGLTVIPGGNGVSVNRAILAGPENPVERMKLRLTFTTY